MAKQVVATQKAPQAIGPYSQAVKAGAFLFISGQIALDPESGEMVSADVEAQTERVMQNLKAVLEAGGAALEDVVKCTIYLKDMSDFATVNKTYARFFGDNPPARATVAVSTLPKDALVEIDATAYSG